MDIPSSKKSMQKRFHESWWGSCFGHCCYGNFRALVKLARNLRLWEHCRRGQVKMNRARDGDFSVRLCLLVMSEATPIESHQYDTPKFEPNKDNTNGHTKVNGKDPLSESMCDSVSMWCPF